MSSSPFMRPVLPVIILVAFFFQGATAFASDILFIGHSFVYGYGSPVQFYHPETITDLNGNGAGGVPALFKSFTRQAGLDFNVNMEAASGKGLDYHYANKADVIGKPWDCVVMVGYSTLDQAKPGDPALLIKSARQVAELLHSKNTNVDIRLMATWSRADQTYLPSGHWYGKPIDAMEKDVRAAYDQAAAGCPYIKGVIPVGETWNHAMESGFADPNPFDGITRGQVDLWTFDDYHGSTFGYYLEALADFGAITELDPRSLGAHERSAYELGISTDQAVTMQKIAYEQLVADGHKNLKPFPPQPIPRH
jgi:hypothetical protein